jgi:hypothetical protein
MRTLDIELYPPPLQPQLFLGYRRRGLTLDLTGQITMHPLVTAVLFRMPRVDPFQLDIQCPPPCAEPGQPAWAGE